MEESKQTNPSNDQAKEQNETVFGGFKIAEDQGSGETTSKESKPEEPEVAKQSEVVETPTEKEPVPAEEAPAQNKNESDTMNLFDGFPVADDNNEASTDAPTSTPVTEEKQDSNIQSPTKEVVEPESQTTVQENPVSKEEENPIPPVNGVEMTPSTEPSDNNDNNKDQNNNENTEKKGVDFFLIGLFVLLAIVIFNLPTISSYLKGDKKKATPTPTPTATPTATPTPTPIAYTKLTCNAVGATDIATAGDNLPELYTYTSGGVMKSTSRVFYSIDGKLKQVENIITIDYQTVDTTNQAQFDQQKQRCDTLSETPISVSGYKYTCKQTGNKFVETEKFDLTKTDQGVSVVKDGQQTVVSSGYLLDDNVNTIQTSITQSGTITCK